MKKIIPIILALLLLLTACGQEPAVTEYATVSVLTRYEYTTSTTLDSFGSFGSTSCHAYEYDKYGNRTVDKWYADGELTYAEYVSYDENGRETGTLSVDHQGWIPWPDSRTATQYDENGNKVLRIVYEPWKETQRSIREYDDQGNCIHLEIRNADGNIIIQDYTYDENGNRLSTTSDSGDGIICTTKYSYDASGNPTGWKYYEDDVLVEYVESLYDSQGRKSFSARYQADGTQKHTWEYSYDDEANTVTTKYTDGSTETVFYDDQDRPLRTEKYNEDGTLTGEGTYTYETIQVPAK